MTSCLLLAALLAIWLCSSFGPLSLLLPIVGIGAMVFFLRHRRFTAALVVILVTPPSLSLLWGIIDYVNGNARLRYSGLPGTEFHNLDPELRCGRRTHGCCVSGHEWVTQMPYNATVRLLTATCGWMPGTYEGPYPTETEAIDAIANGSIVSISDVKNDHLLIDGASIQLDEGVGAELLERLAYPDGFFGEAPPNVTATVWQRECVVLRVPVWDYPRDDTPSAAIVLISQSAGRPFAYYAEGDYAHHFPPVTWKRPPN